MARTPWGVRAIRGLCQTLDPWTRRSSHPRPSIPVAWRQITGGFRLNGSASSMTHPFPAPRVSITLPTIHVWHMVVVSGLPQQQSPTRRQVPPKWPQQSSHARCRHSQYVIST